MRFSRITFAAAALALAVLQPVASRAFDIPTFDFGNDAPMPAAVVQLYTDLNGIAVGATPTDTQHQAIVADLNALASGIFTPDPADIDQLATDLGTAATNGLFSDNVLEYLADDFIGDPDDPTADPDGWMDDIQDDVASLINPPPDLGGDPGDPVDPVDTTIYELGATATGGERSIRTVVPLAAQGNPPFLLENYSGRLHLGTRTVGGATTNTLRLTTFGLPPSNPYTVSITRQSDGQTVVIGKLHVRSDFSVMVPRLGASGGILPQAELLTYSHTTFGGSNVKKPLPSAFDATDVATVTVTDSQGVVRLSGTVVGGTPSIQVQALRIRLSGTAITPAHVPSANVAVRHKATSAKTSNRFRLMARHLPANIPVTLLADGVTVDQYVTTAHGRLFVIEGFEPSKLNRQGISPPFNALRPGTDLSGAKTFTLTDAQGMVLLSGSLD